MFEFLHLSLAEITSWVLRRVKKKNDNLYVQEDRSAVFNYILFVIEIKLHHFSFPFIPPVLDMSLFILVDSHFFFVYICYICNTRIHVCTHIHANTHTHIYNIVCWVHLCAYGFKLPTLHWTTNRGLIPGRG